MHPLMLFLMMLHHTLQAHQAQQQQSSSPQTPGNLGTGNPSLPPLSQSPTPMGGKQVQAAQGANGMTQGHMGGTAPMAGGLGSLYNQMGMYPHQQQTGGPGNPIQRAGEGKMSNGAPGPTLTR